MSRFIVFLLAIVCPGIAGPPVLSAESRLVKRAYLVLKANPASAKAQSDYLLAFPKTKDKFLRIFMDAPKYGQLYDGHEYIDALQRIGRIQPNAVIHICFGLDKDLVATSDAVSHIQEATENLGIAHPQAFVAQTKQLTDSEQLAVCHFLADKETIEYDEEFDLLAKRVAQVGATGFAAKLRRAKLQRMKEPRH